VTLEGAALATIVAFAFVVQTSVGFGAMLCCVTFGAWLLPLPELLVRVVPLSMVQAVVIVGMYRGVAIDLLGRRVLPLALLGLAAGVALSDLVTDALKPLLGLLVLLLALRELWRGRGAPAPSPLASGVAFVGAGLLQGLFATGGPPLVWGLASQGLPKTAFRSTLVTALFAMNVGLVGSFVWRGTLTLATTQTTAWLLLPMGVGIMVGDWVHHRVDEATFRRAVWGLLAIGALPLIASSLT